MSLTELEYEEHRDETLKGNNLTVNANEEVESGEETTEEYYKWMEEINQKFDQVLTWSEHDAIEKTW
ncbi:hypothetical protein F8M41_011144 [Gigaspora margarita]|uniref:Uncharacterized protein n=1 Tax=Gigaspora margarita TaxID=4874 RepID=A0A8H3X0D8_GIGMA|nr:hypothetical protein F8M41_011144 [Gigaspora margarita]